MIGNVASVFDIEATSFYLGEEKRCCMYAWVFGINGRCIRGRTWNEFIDVIDTLTKHYELSDKKRLIIYVHNLSYEFQWFKKYFEWEKVFSLDTRKPVYAITKNGIEFRCSYILSGYSLEKLGENLTKYKVEKKVGDLDYSLIRHSQTPLTEREWGYILNDGLVVMAHIQEEIERLGNIAQLPLTKTGYVRELFRQNCLKGEHRYDYSRVIRGLTMTTQNYYQLKRVYTGGFTHANVNYVNKVINNVHSFDFSSSYPAVMISEKYPMSKPHFAKIESEKQLLNYLQNYCCMFDVTFYNIEATTPYENYISVSRCFERETCLLNNGRLREADKISISVTEQDFFIISKMYKWESMEISNFYYFYKGYLPKDFIKTILDLYKDKTELKGIPEKIVEYLVSKGMINAGYGMCVTDPCKDEIIYEDDTWGFVKSDTESLIEQYNKSRTRFLYYPWGVWITAYARRNLFTGILEFKDDYVYSDTDSIKVINVEKHREYIERYNRRVTEKVKNCLDFYGLPFEMSCPKTIKGVSKPIGVWDYEGMYTRFKTLGAKRYLVESDGDVEITIAGVGKKAGTEYLKYTYNNNDSIFDAFSEDLVFPAHYDHDGEDLNGCGKLLHSYIDYYIEGEIIDYMGNTYVYNEQSGVHMENTEYHMTLDFEFRNLIYKIESSHIVKEGGF